MNTVILNILNFFKSSWMKLLPYFIIAALGFMLYFATRKVIAMNSQISTYSANMKAYDAQLSGLKKDNQMFQFTKGQLESLNDSLVDKLLAKSKELGIKTSKIQQLQYLKSKVYVRDSLIYDRDTIFRDQTVHIDTVIGDKWCSTRLRLDYPSSVRLESTVNSEKFIYVVSKRETVNPPKKFFLFRWFQKKHTILEIHVADNNPYIINKEQKFIKIIQ